MSLAPSLLAVATAAVLAVSLTLAFSYVAAEELYTYKDYQDLTSNIPVNTTTLHLLHVKEAHHSDPNRTISRVISYPPTTVSGTPDLQLVNWGGENVSVKFFRMNDYAHFEPVNVPAMSTVDYTLAGEGLYTWTGDGFHTYHKNASRAELTSLAPVPATATPTESLYNRTTQVRIPTSVVTLVTASNLTAGVPVHALPSSAYIAFAAPSGGPSYDIEVWGPSYADTPLTMTLAPTANFTLKAGTNHAVDLPGEGYYHWTANGTLAEGRVSYFG